MKQFFVLPCFFLMACNFKEKKYTEISLPEKEFDFGTVKSGDTLNHIFRIINIGADTLRIIKTSGSCNCLSPHINKSTASPNDSIFLLVSVVSKKESKGPFSEVIIIEANTEKSFTTLGLRGSYSE